MVANGLRGSEAISLVLLTLILVAFQLVDPNVNVAVDDAGGFTTTA